MKKKDFYLIKYKVLKKILELILIEEGSPKHRARLVSTFLAKSDLSGQNSHGSARLSFYLDKIKKGEILPKAKAKILKQTKNTAKIDGGWGFGQVNADLAVKLLIKKAKKNFTSCVTLKNSNHCGRLSDYTNQAAKKNLICIAFSNLHGTSHIVAPFGGIDRKLPSNPIAVSTPGETKNSVFELDMSTCMVSEGKLKIDYLLGKKTSKNYIQDYYGKVTRQTKKFYENPKGSILPLGGISGYKGYGLAMAIDILSGALSEAGCSGPKHKQHGNAVTFFAININSFTSINKFRGEVKKLIKHVKSSRKKNFSKEILIPGEFEKKNRLTNLKKGIKIDRVTYHYINNIKDMLGIKLKLS